MVERAAVEFGMGCFLDGDHAWTPCAARVRARTMLCLASSTLKALCSSGFAPATAKAAGLATVPTRNLSASGERQGLWATPPSARPADWMVLPLISRPAATETRA